MLLLGSRDLIHVAILVGGVRERSTVRGEVVLVLVGQVGEQQLHGAAGAQAGAEHHRQVDGQGEHAASDRAVADALREEGQVVERRVRIHEQEHKDFHNQAVFVL